MKSCLIVDDSTVVRKVARRILEDMDFIVDEAEDGQEAFDKCRQEMPDTILLDWQMPIMSGLEFLKLLRAYVGGTTARVVYCVTEYDVGQIALAKKAREISPIPFEVTEGLRTKERQRYLVRTGKSRTMKSYHLRGKAMDFVAMPGGKVSWDLKDYKTIVEKAFKPAAKALGLTDAEIAALVG